MRYSQLGTSELRVSEICLGTMTFGQQNTIKEAHAQLDYALDRGVNFIDTAEMYPVPIIGAAGLTQLEENLGSVATDLDELTLAAIDAVHTRFPSPAP
jgi:aryl-alcohol dehydrogenase-like predicted oxidoreductase